ncbi:MAG: hypothetical protein RKO25_12225 [Candidatus Contendobacter sp.]|nr:hypothetical protein [Candidatus Contendobacter sp.]
MNADGINDKEILWLVIVHPTLVVSALLLAAIDKIAFAQHRY